MQLMHRIQYKGFTMFVVLSPLAVEEEHIPTYEPVTLEPSKTSYMQLVYQLNTFLFNLAIILENFDTHSVDCH